MIAVIDASLSGPDETPIYNISRVCPKKSVQKEPIWVTPKIKLTVSAPIGFIGEAIGDQVEVQQ